MPILSTIGGASIRTFGRYAGGAPALFAFTSTTFTSSINAGAYSSSNSLQAWGYGPSNAALLTYYGSNNTYLYNLLQASTYFKVPYNGYQWFVVPQTANYTISARGGTGGSTTAQGRGGCIVSATFSLTSGQILWIAVGHSGASGNSTSNDYCSAGGGGATIVALAPSTGGTTLSNISYCLLCAAGGKGSREARFGPSTPAVSSSANGTTGAGFTDRFVLGNNNGSYGGYGGRYASGGFGGGTGSDDNEGFAGGYDAYYTSSPNSYVHSSGSSVTRTDDGGYNWPNPGTVTITKL